MKKNIKLLIILLIIIGLIVVVLGLINNSSKFNNNNQLSFNNHKNMIITSPAFIDGQAIPLQYGCKGENINPPLEIGRTPVETKSLVLIVDDPDAPAGNWAHWLVWNISPVLTSLAINSVPAGAIQGLNDFGNNNYGGPCPHSGTHHYHFKIYALDTKLDLLASTKKDDLVEAIKDHILDQAILIGTYSY